jgi:hypothetical protein
VKIISTESHGIDKKRITERTVIYRINKVLTKKGQFLHRCRKTDRLYATLGDYHIEGDGQGYLSVKETHIDIEKMGREMGVINTWEMMG